MAANKKFDYLKHAISYYAYLLVFWGFYRLLFQAPAPLEELIVKPAIWLLPLALLLKKEKASLRSIGVTFNNFFKVVYFVLALGFVFTIFAIVVNFLKYGSLSFASNIGVNSFWIAIGLSFITAISEELVFRGYLLTRLLGFVKNSLKANVILSIGWALIHLPVAILDWRMEPLQVGIYSLIVFSFSIGATFVFLKTKNIAAPILLHVLWQWPIILFR